MIYELDGQKPQVPEDGRYWVAPSAAVIGRVRLNSDCSVWFGAVLRGVYEHQFVGILASFFAQVREDGDISSHNRLNRSAKISDNAARAHDNSPNNAKVFDDAVAGQFECGCDHAGIDATVHDVPASVE